MQDGLASVHGAARAPTSTTAPLAEPTPGARSGHLRLIAFFVVLVALGSAAGVLVLPRAQTPTQRALALVLILLITHTIALAGVLFHRLRVIRARWRETELYLLQIRRESAKYRALLEGAADMLLLVDTRADRVLEENALARDVLGFPAAPAERPRLEALVAERDLARLRSGLERALAEPGAAISLGEVLVRGRDEPELAVDARLAVIDLEDARVALLALRDLRAQKQIERQLHISERLSSLGLLTAGVAHEINNPLEGIGNYLALLERDSLPPEQRARYLEALRHGFGRIRDIASDLLRFTRPSAGGQQADLVGVVERALSLVRYASKVRSVDIRSVELVRPLEVVGDAGRLEQVVVNLLINAATASGPNGHVEVRARRVAEPTTGSHEIELCVEDDGPGIPAEDLQRIFEPFFSSTEGSGLGLAVSYGIVAAHGGRLSAENREQGGARFRLRLSAVPVEPKAPAPRPT